MGYIKSEKHFLNFIKHALRNNKDINVDKLLDDESYIYLIYSKGHVDYFTWDVREDPYLLEKDNLLNWLREKEGYSEVFIPYSLEHIIIAELNAELIELNNVPGIYSFWADNDIPLYVGTSINLGERILTSFSERFQRFKEQIYLKYIKAETKSDAAILELYFIGKLKPALNGTFKYDDAVTLRIVPKPKFSKSILCNRIEKVEDTK